jgi:hypothetical protein
VFFFFGPCKISYSLAIATRDADTQQPKNVIVVNGSRYIKKSSGAMIYINPKSTGHASVISADLIGVLVGN